jgi:uncharacterized protein DUF4440
MTMRLSCLLLLILANLLPVYGRDAGVETPPGQTHPQTGLQQRLISAEQNLLDALERGDLLYVRNAVSDDFYAIGTNGDNFGKADLLEGLHEDDSRRKAKPILYFFQVVPLNDRAAVVTYDAVFPGRHPRYQHLSNTWVQEGDQWKLKFQQSTPNLWSANDL